METLSIVLQSLLVAYYLFSGVAKIIGAKYWVDMFDQIKLPHWLRIVTGFVQLVGAAGLIVGYWYAGALVWACIWLGINMLFAGLAHIRVKDAIGQTITPFVFFILITILLIINIEHLQFPL